MELLMSNEGRPMAREEIGKQVWGEGYANEEKIVDVNIRRLRMKLEENPSEPKYIKTIWGSGYCWGEYTPKVSEEK
jgi:DNA-binding response OmpR family regulator